MIPIIKRTRKTVANNENVLYDFNYDSWNNCFECEVLIHKDFIFPNLCEDKISKIVLAETGKNLQNSTYNRYRVIYESVLNNLCENLYSNKKKIESLIKNIDNNIKMQIEELI